MKITPIPFTIAVDYAVSDHTAYVAPTMILSLIDEHSHFDEWGFRLLWRVRADTHRDMLRHQARARSLRWWLGIIALVVLTAAVALAVAGG